MALHEVPLSRFNPHLTPLEGTNAVPLSRTAAVPDQSWFGICNAKRLVTESSVPA